MSKEHPEVVGFDWDAGNRDKNLKHGVQTRECEQVFFNQPLVTLDDPKRLITENREAAFGQTDQGRKLALVYTMRFGLIRVISARDMNRRERQFYEHATKDDAGI